MKKFATEFLMPFEISLINSSVENVYKLLALSPDKFEEITSGVCQYCYDWLIIA